VNKVIKLASLVLAGAVIVGCSDKKAKEEEQKAAMPIPHNVTTMPAATQPGGMMDKMNGEKDKMMDKAKDEKDKMMEQGTDMKDKMMGTTKPAGM
jgi:hypothetical protein